MLLVLIIASVLGVTAAWLAGEAVRETFQISAKAQKLMSQQGPDLSLYNLEKPSVDSRNQALAGGLSGAILGFVLGLAGGVARGSRARAVIAAGMGLALGAIAAAGTAFVAVPLHHRWFDRASSSLLQPMATQFFLWGIGPSVAGMAYGWAVQGREGAMRGIFAALAGSIAGVITFSLVMAFAFPLERNDEVLPSDATHRLLGQALVGLFAVACAAAVSRLPEAATSRRV